MLRQFRKIPTALLAAMLFLAVSPAAPSAASGAATRTFLDGLASQFVAIGGSLSNARLVERGHLLAARAAQIPAAELGVSQTSQSQFHRILDRLSFVARRLPQPAVQPRHPGADEEWPIADCAIASEDAASWAGLAASIGALTTAELALIAMEESCYGPEIEPVVSTPLVVAGECFAAADDFGGGEGSIEVVDPAEIEWAGAMNAPSLCIALDTAVTAAELTATELEAYLACWNDAWVDTNYDRLEVLHQELAELEEGIDILIRFEIETQLQVLGGRRLADLYLPESLGGQLEAAATFAETAVNETAAAGYQMDPRAHTALDLAPGKVAAGDFKKVYDLYREAYREATGHSRRLLP
ncbi:MAG: hypothetical protein ABGY42_04940 [bacterium]